jgi:hypothetical protein
MNARSVLWPCLAVLCLWAGREVQEQRASLSRLEPESRAEGPPGADFFVYYVAGRVVRGLSTAPLYQVDTVRSEVPGAPIETLNPSLRRAPEGSPWAEAFREAGLSGVQTQFYLYPPMFALLVEPLAGLRPAPALAVWQALTLLALIGSLWLALSCLSQPPPILPSLVIATLGAISFYPLVETLHWGQVGVFILFLWSAGAYSLRRGRQVASAFCIALGTLVKLTPAALVPVMLMRRQWRWLAAYAGWLFLLTAVAVAALGLPVHRTFLSQVMPALTQGAPLASNQSIGTLVQFAYLGRVLETLPDALNARFPAALGLLSKIIAGGIFAAFLLGIRRRSAGDTHLVAEFITTAVLATVLSPLSWRHGYVLTILPLVYYWARYTRSTPAGSLGVALFAATLLIGSVIPQWAVQLAPQGLPKLILVAAMPAGALLVLLVAFRFYGVLDAPLDVARNAPATA